MPIMTAERIHAARAAVTWWARSIGIALIAVGAYLVFKRLLFAPLSGTGFVGMLQTWNEIGEGHDFYRGTSMIVVGAAISAASARLARWVIMVPESGCPACGYPASTSADVTCSECGYRGPP